MNTSREGQADLALFGTPEWQRGATRVRPLTFQWVLEILDLWFTSSITLGKFVWLLWASISAVGIWSLLWFCCVFVSIYCILCTCQVLFSVLYICFISSSPNPKECVQVTQLVGSQSGCSLSDPRDHTLPLKEGRCARITGSPLSFICLAWNTAPNRQKPLNCFFTS